LCTEHIGLDDLEGIVFGCRHLLQCGGVDDSVDPLHGPTQAVVIAHVTDKVTQPLIIRTVEHLVHLELLELIA
jgi:hypothetical protein